MKTNRGVSKTFPADVVEAIWLTLRCRSVASMVLLLLVSICAVARPGTVLATDWFQNRGATDFSAGPDREAPSLGEVLADDYFQAITPTANGRLQVFAARTQSQVFIDGASANVVSSGPRTQDWLRRVDRANMPDSAAEPSALSLATFPIQADPSFSPALEQLLTIKHTWTLQALATSNTRLEWALMAPDAAGSFLPDQGVITFNARWYKSDPRALAALVEHEGKHVADALAGLDVASPAGCLVTEVNAFREEAKTWGELVGVTGKADPRDDLERSLNNKLSILQQKPDAIQALIANSPSYQAQCKLR